MEPIVEVKRADLAYLVKVADWAAGQGFCGIEGIEDPDEWCYRHWDDTRPDGYSADALVDYLSTPSPDLKADNAALVEALQLIADERGHCRTCRTLASDANCTECDCSYPCWEPMDAPAFARAVLQATGPRP